jgi:tetratricopeptide (TPR) repeat protein
MLDNDPVVTSSALTAMAIVFLDERGDIERSIKYLDRAVESNPDNHNAWFNLIPVLASKFDLERADLVKQIAMLLREKERLNFDPFNHQLIRLNQEITSLIKKYHEIGYRCPACKKKQDIAKFCRYCGSKLGISKDDMNKDIDLKSELQKRKSDPIFSQIRSFTKSDLLKILSKQKWKPFTKICLELNVKSEKDIKDLMDLVQSLVIERKIVQNFKGAVLELKKI